MTDDQAEPPPALEVHGDAAAEIEQHGGCVYVWADGAGMKHIRYDPPQRSVETDWIQLDADSVRVFIDPAIRQPTKWVIALRHIPYRHVTALYNGYVPGAIGIGMTVPKNI